MEYFTWCARVLKFHTFVRSRWQYNILMFSKHDLFINLNFSETNFFYGRVPSCSGFQKDKYETNK
jgi:hypothetical protein